MPFPSDRLLPDVLAYLRRIADLEPAEARELLGELRERHGVPMRLVWQRDFPGGSRHYDVLITAEDGAVSVAFAPDRALPWPLRGSRHAGEQVVLRLNGMDITMEHALAVLDVLWNDTGMATRLVNAGLVEQELAGDPVDLPSDELQEALDAFRRARGLLTVQATRDWMAERGLDHAHLEEIVASEAAIARLRRRVAGDAAPEVFAADPGGHDRLCVLRLRYPRPEAARAAVARLGGAGPFQAAGLLGLASGETLDHGADSEMGRAFRRDLGPMAATAVAGDVLGPPEHGAEVICVLEVRPAVLDDATRREIEKALFDQWLAGRRHEAKLEWLWGTAPRTGSVTKALREPIPGARPAGV
ncbi:TIGR04500 family putative peptide maturation system protein [Sphaerisporangium sp. NBC_01403]|uniref:TIGR04500 family putative peptide maturation system protein n=1 Tax=Sphaerisporangium sp. NBC_01403 TaxID=2903599 RepID=UPI0032445E0E